MEPEPELEQLNPREIEILTLIADGLSNREIAQKLHLSQETVKWYNKQIFAKLGAASRTQAVSIAKKHRLLKTMQLPSRADGPFLTEQSSGPGVANRSEPLQAGSRAGTRRDGNCLPGR